MKPFSRSIFSVFSVVALTFCVGLTAFAQDGAGDVDADGGSKIIRIGVLMPKVNLREATGDVEPGVALRNTYGALLNGDYFELVALDAKLTSLVLSEARKKNVDYILHIDLEQVAKKKRSGLFGKIARDTGRRASWETARKVPYGGGTGGRIARTTARSAILNTGYTMSNMSVEVKKNDKFKLEYNLTNTGTGKVFHTKKIEAKAKKNNDAVLMRIIEESANDMVLALKKVIPQ